MQAPSENALRRISALHALLDEPDNVVERINALDEESIVIVTTAAARKCHEVLWDDTEQEQPKKRKAAWHALRRTQKVQEWFFDLHVLVSAPETLRPKSVLGNEQ